ncbi:MAG: response regulator [Chloroflexi bacterium]|nr:response regulator [Chloroflexota bacterium]
MNATSETHPALATSDGESLRRRCLIGTEAFLLLSGLALIYLSQFAGSSHLLLVVGWLATLVALLTTPVVLRWVRAGVALLAVGMASLILLATCWLQAGPVLALMTIPVAFLVVAAGWRVAAIAAMTCSIAAVLVGHALHDPIAAAVTVALLATTAAYASAALLLAEEIIHWYEASWSESRQQLEEARSQRLEFKQAREDLVLANTELARLTERLDAMRRLAEDSRNAKEEFVANVSHELRTPLNMIIGFAEMIAQAPRAYGRLPPRLLADIEVILANSRHLSSLVDDVLDLSQTDVGRMALTRRWVSVNAIIATAVSAVKPLFDSRGLWLHAEVPDGLMAYCDEVRIRQVVVNLLSNAGRYTESGGAKIRAWAEDGDVLVAVQDTGVGISAEHQEMIFGRFQRVQSVDGSKVKGSGLGLAISRRFVELHGGRMWVESKENTGSVFTFRLPVDGADSGGELNADVRRWFSPYHQYDARRRPSEAPVRQLGPRFVVVERGNVVQRLLARYQADAEIVSASTIEEAVAQCQRVPALALVVNQPGTRYLSGQSAELATLPYGIPVLCCWVPDRQEAAEELGVLDYLLKPVSRESLLEAVAAAQPPAQSILVVDDEADALQLFSRMLAASERGYRVLSAQSGAEALGLMRQRRPDLILLDLVMPGMDGYTLLRIKRDDPEIAAIPVIAVSAQDPAGGPLPSNYVAIARGGGLYAQDLLNTIHAVTAVLTPSGRRGDREPERALRA